MWRAPRRSSSKSETFADPEFTDTTDSSEHHPRAQAARMRVPHVGRAAGDPTPRSGRGQRVYERGAPPRYAPGASTTRHRGWRRTVSLRRADIATPRASTCMHGDVHTHLFCLAGMPKNADRPTVTEWACAAEGRTTAVKLWTRAMKDRVRASRRTRSRIEIRKCLGRTDGCPKVYTQAAMTSALRATLVAARRPACLAQRLPTPHSPVWQEAPRHRSILSATMRARMRRGQSRPGRSATCDLDRLGETDDHARNPHRIEPERATLARRRGPLRREREFGRTGGCRVVGAGPNPAPTFGRLAEGHRSWGSADTADGRSAGSEAPRHTEEAAPEPRPHFRPHAAPEPRPEELTARAAPAGVESRTNVGESGSLAELVPSVAPDTARGGRRWTASDSRAHALAGMTGSKHGRPGSCAWPAAGSSSACKASMSCLSLGRTQGCAIQRATGRVAKQTPVPLDDSANTLGTLAKHCWCKCNRASHRHHNNLRMPLAC